MVGVLRGLTTYDILADLGRYPGPVLSVITPLNHVPFSLHKLVPRIRHQRVSGTGHWPQLDRPEEINRLIDAFVAEVEGGGSAGE